ncbi:hypothetical protein JCM19000A_39960 [Silvimonas sp. JCM 19000]
MQFSHGWRGLLAALCTTALLAACGTGNDNDTDAGGSSGGNGGTTAPPVAAATMRVHYHRTQNDTADWGVYSWKGPKVTTANYPADRIKFSSSDSFGGYTDIAMDTSNTEMDFLVINGNGDKNCSSDQVVQLASTLASAGQEIWLLQGDCTIYATQPAIPLGNLSAASAIWLDAQTLVWADAPSSGSYKLYYAPDGGISADANGVSGAAASVDLTADGSALTATLAAAHPNLASATVLKLAAQDAATLKTWLKGQLVAAQLDSAGKVVQATSVQIAPLLDALYADAAAATPLGLTFAIDGTPTFALWAPTATTVTLNVTPVGGTATTLAMTQDAASGIWQATGQAAWTNAAYYTYDVNVFSRAAGNKRVTNTVTDPYSVTLDTNSQHSMVANLASAALKPSSWDTQAIPALASNADISLYELHLRDFSINDATVPAAHQGKYLAFTDSNSNGMQHLRALQAVGLTHVHLLPLFDISSVDESGCINPTIPNAAADAQDQQAAVVASADKDCFNWGYDPYHYTAPEGSYASNAADGTVRVKEFRQMVQALHAAGLRVVMDVVYNHTSAAGQASTSVLDKVVPGYYYRLDGNGAIYTSTCCSDTATENRMMARLMIDSLATWAAQYKVDGFRFDLMGHIPLAVMQQARSTVDAAALRPLYYYGEAWNFGEVQDDAFFVQARQAHMAGTGIGSFNDRMRDAVRGGGCCDSGAALAQNQGFANGAYLAPNGNNTQSKDDLLHLADLVRLGMVATLADYTLVDKDGNSKRGDALDYSGMGAGYTQDPPETINYIEAHDNQTLFDINTLKLKADTPAAQRVRVQNLGAGVLLLSQGIPFIHAGQDILRSKSLDSNSFNSGDWFNKLDWSYQANNFGVGLPPAADNSSSWDTLKPFLTNANVSMGNAQIVNARDVFRDFMAIRQSSTLFRLRSGADVKQRVSFINTGPSQVPGVIIEHIDGSGYSGANYSHVVIAVNADIVAHSVAASTLAGPSYTLHPRQQSGADSVVQAATLDSSGNVSIPARSVAVFVAP